jgi:NAD(P)-dependent dehydrogenase (short-subunit alcohol dehydrogenase family)
MAAELAGKVAFVTGAASGIGRQSALAFAAAGAKVAVADIAEEGAAETVKLIQGKGGEARFVRCDVADTSSVQAAIRAVVDAYGALDCAHNNAGILGTPGEFDSYDEALFDRVIRINLTGVFLCMKYELQVMKRQGRGAIVNTASVAAILASPGLPSYNASKHGVVGLTKSAAVGYAKAGIRVNAVCPGFIDTPMTRHGFGPIDVEARGAELHATGKVGLPEEVAAVVVWLCADAASLVTGVALPVDGGWTITT